MASWRLRFHDKWPHLASLYASTHNLDEDGKNPEPTMGQDNVFDITEPYSVYRYYLPSTRSEFSIEEPSYSHRPTYKEDESKSSGLVSGDSFRRGSTCRVLLCVFLIFSFIAVVVAAITLAVLLSETHRFPRRTTVEKYESNASLLGRDFHQNLLNKSSDDFKKLEEQFCTAIQQMFTTPDSPVLTEFADCEVVEFLNGSILVRYRIGLRQKVAENIKTDDTIEEKLRAHFKNKINEHGSWNSVKLHPQFIEKFIKVESTTTAGPITTSEQRHTMSTQTSSFTTLFTNITLESRKSTPEYLSTFEQKKIASTTDKEIHPTAFISVTEDRITTVGRMLTTDKDLTRTSGNFTAKPVLEKMNKTLHDVSFEGQPLSSTEFQLLKELGTAESREVTSVQTDSFAKNASSLNYTTATQRSMARTDAIRVNTSSFQPVIGVHKTTEFPILLRTETKHVFVEDEKTTQLIPENTSNSLLEVSSEVQTTEQELVQKLTTAWQPTKTSKDIALADVKTTEIENMTVSDKTRKNVTTTERRATDSFPSSTYAYSQSSEKTSMSTSSTVKKLTEPREVVVTNSTVEQRITTAPMTSTSDTWYESTDFIETVPESTTWIEEDTTPPSTKHMSVFTKYVSLMVDTQPSRIVTSAGPSITISPAMPGSSTHLIIEPKFEITTDSKTEVNTTEIYATLPRTHENITKIIGQTTFDDVVHTTAPYDTINKTTSLEVFNKTTHVRATASTMPTKSKFISEEPVEGFTSQFHPLTDGINVASVDRKKTVDITEGNLVPSQTTHISFTSFVSSATSLTQVQTVAPQEASGLHQIGKFVTERMPSVAEITRSSVATNITNLTAQRFETTEGHQTTINTTKSREFKTTAEPITQTTESYERTSIYTAPSFPSYQTTTDTTRNILRKTVKTTETVAPTRDPSEKNSTYTTSSSIEVFKLTVKEGGTLDVNISFASPFVSTQIPVLNDTSKALESFIKLDTPKPSTKLTGRMIAETTQGTSLQKSESTVSTTFKNTSSPIIHGVTDRSPNDVVTHSKGNVSVSAFSEVSLTRNDTGGPITHSVADYYDYDVTNESLTNDTLLDVNNFPMLNESNISAIEAIEITTKPIFTIYETTNSANVATVYPHINISDETSSRRSRDPMHTGDRDTNVLARVITREPAKLASTNEFASSTTYISTEYQPTIEQTVIKVSRAGIPRVLGMTTHTRINVTDPVSMITSTTSKPIHSPERSFQATVTTPSMKAAFGIINITKTFSENIIPTATSEQVSIGDTVDSVTPERPNKLIYSLIPTEFPGIHNKTGDPTLFTELVKKSDNVTAALTDSNITENIGASAERSTFHDIIGIEHDNVSRKTIHIKETTMHAMSPNLTMSATLPATLAMHSSVTKKKAESTISSGDAHDRFHFSEISTKSHLVDNGSSIAMLSTPATKDNVTEHLKEAISRLKQIGEHFVDSGSLRVSDNVDVQTVTNMENVSNIASSKTIKSKTEFTEKYIFEYVTVTLGVNASLNDSTFITKVALFKNTTANETIFVTPPFINNVTTFVDDSAIEHTTANTFSRKSDMDQNVTAMSQNINSERILRNSSIADGTTLIRILSSTSDKEKATKSLSDVMTESMSTIAEKDAGASMTSADNTTIISVQNDTAITSTETIFEQTKRAVTDIDHDTFSLVNVTHSAEKKGRSFNSEDFALGIATFNASTFNSLPDAVTMIERVGDSSQKDDNARTKSITFTANPITIADHDERFLMDYNLTSHDSSETTTSVNTLMSSFSEGRSTTLPVQGIEGLVSTDENLGDNATSVKATAIQNKTEILSNKTLRISADTIRTSSISGAMTTSTDANSNIALFNFLTNETEIAQTTITLHFMRKIPLDVGNGDKKASKTENPEQSTTFYNNFTRKPIANGAARSQASVSSVDELLLSETKSTPLSTPAVPVGETTTNSSISYSIITSTDADSSELNVHLATEEIPNDTTISFIGSDYLTTTDKSIELGTNILSKMSTLSNINLTSMYIENFSLNNKTSLLTNFIAVTQQEESDSHTNHAFIDITTINATIPHYSNMSLSNESFNGMNKTSLNETESIFTAGDVFVSTTPYERATEGHIAKGLNATTTTVHPAEMMDKIPTVDDTINSKDEILIKPNIKSLVQDVTQSMKQSVQTTVNAIINKEASKNTAKAFVEATQTSKFTDVTRATTLPSQISQAFTSEIITPTTQATNAVLTTPTLTTKGTSMHIEETISYYYEDMNTTDYYYENYTEFEVFQAHTESPINVDVNNTKPANESDIVNKTRHEKPIIGNAKNVIISPTTSRDSIIATETDINGSIAKLVAVAATNNSKEVAASILHAKPLSESALNNTKLISNSPGSHPVSESPAIISKTVAFSSTNSINPHTELPANTLLPFAAPTVNTTKRPLVPFVNTTQPTKKSDTFTSSTLFTVNSTKLLVDVTTNVDEVSVAVDEGLLTDTWITTEKMVP